MCQEPSSSLQDTLATAADPTTPVMLLEQLARDYAIDRLAATYADTPLELIQDAASLPRVAVAEALVGNPNMPLDALLKLAPHFPAQFFVNPVFPLLFLEDPNWPAALPVATAGALLREATAPANFITHLLRHPDPVVRQAARWHVVITGEAGSDWAALARDAVASRIFAAIDTSPDRHIPFGVFLQGGVVPLWLLEAFVGHQQSQIKALALVNPDLPAALHEVAVAGGATGHHPSYLHAREVWLQQYVIKVASRSEHYEAQRFSVSPETLTQLAQRPDWLTRRYVALNPATPLTVLKHLANDAVPDVAEAVTLHPRTTPALAWHIYARLVTSDIPTRHVFYRIVAFASSFMTPRRVAAHIGAADWVERLALARNPRIPDAALVYLTTDGNTLVRAAARAMLQARLLLTLTQGIGNFVTVVNDVTCRA